MSEHRAAIRWQSDAEAFRDGSYSRAHFWSFDGGVTVPASPSPAVVRAPLSDPHAVDPEEAFVAAIASCHMLTFLYYAQRSGLCVEAYADDAVGYMTKNSARVPWVSLVELRPEIRFAGEQPDGDAVRHLHEEAHAKCFIANSVKTKIVVLS